jgi:hypothetical protein
VSRGNINSVVIFFHDILDILKCLCLEVGVHGRENKKSFFFL